MPILSLCLPSLLLVAAIALSAAPFAAAKQPRKVEWVITEFASGALPEVLSQIAVHPECSTIRPPHALSDTRKGLYYTKVCEGMRC